MTKNKFDQLNNVWIHFYFCSSPKSTKNTQEKSEYEAWINGEKLSVKTVKDVESFASQSDVSYEVICFFSILLMVRFLSEQCGFVYVNSLDLFYVQDQSAELHSYGFSGIDLSQLMTKKSGHILLDFEKIKPLLMRSLEFQSSALESFQQELMSVLCLQCLQCLKPLTLEKNQLSLSEAKTKFLKNAKEAKNGEALANVHNQFFIEITSLVKLNERKQKAPLNNNQKQQRASLSEVNSPLVANHYESAPPIINTNNSINASCAPKSSSTCSFGKSVASTTFVSGSAVLGGVSFAGLFLAMVKVAPLVLAAGVSMSPLGLLVLGLIAVGVGVAVGATLGCTALFFTCNPKKKANIPNPERSSLLATAI